MGGRLPVHGRDHRPGGGDPITFAEYEFKLFPDTDIVETGDGRLTWRVPTSVAGLRLLSAHAYVSTVSTSGKPTVQIYNATTANDMLSTRVEIDANEYDSYTAATQPVVNASYAQVSASDRIRFDIDVAGTGAKGLGVTLTFV